MRHEEHTRALTGALAALGLDLNRYSVAHALDYLARFPDPDVWSCSDARSSLISTFAIGETTFMRHSEHFQAVRSLAPELCERRAGAPLRVFSAGCSSGEEAYSLAATLALSGRPAFEVLAWDMNPEAVGRAVTGEYRPWSLRGVDDAATRGWLEPAPCGVRVAGWLRGLVRFEVGNLYTDPFPAELDLIFCRNVLLYFRRDAAARVLARMAESLRPGGVLFLGYYDPPPAPETGLVQEQLAGAYYYRKRGAAVQAASSPLIRGPVGSLVAQAVQLGRGGAPCRPPRSVPRRVWRRGWRSFASSSTSSARSRRSLCSPSCVRAHRCVRSCTSSRRSPPKTLATCG